MNIKHLALPVIFTVIWQQPGPTLIALTCTTLRALLFEKGGTPEASRIAYTIELPCAAKVAWG